MKDNGRIGIGNIKKNNNTIVTKKNKTVEVFKVLPEYHKISKKRKKAVLLLMIDWAVKELNNI